jgi:calcineurin-like phosphoesterase family protein
MDWFTSDLHLGHANIIRYSNRPFSSVEEMDDAIISNINELVKPDDLLWFLGDFCFGPRDTNGFIRKAENYRRRINCRNIILIWGNHDPDPFSWKKEERQRAELFRQLFSEDYHLRVTQVNRQRVSLCHYAMRVWDKSHRGAWHLYGHSHGSLPDLQDSLSFDCGVDCHAMKPVSFPQVQAIMSKKSFRPIDHHGRE